MSPANQIRLFRLLFGIFLIFIGVIVGIAIRNYYDLTIADTINIVDAVALLVTVFLAVYIPEVLDRQQQVKKDKKDLIERRIEELQGFYRRLNLLIQQESHTIKDNLTIRNTLDICSHRLETIITLLSFLKVKKSFEKEIAEIRRFTQSYRKLLYTEDLEKPDFKYSQEVQDQEELLYNKIDKSASLLIFKISDA